MDDFKQKAQITLDEIFSLVESKYKDFEVDYEDENLRIDSIENEDIYIISIHAPTSQIWLSSPLSGAHHFQISSSAPFIWVSTRDKSIELFNLIEQELNN